MKAVTKRYITDFFPTEEDTFTNEEKFDNFIAWIESFGDKFHEHFRMSLPGKPTQVDLHKIGDNNKHYFFNIKDHVCIRENNEYFITPTKLFNEQYNIIDETNKKLKFSFDLHGVIDALPEFFAFLSRAVIEANGEIHILTGGTLSKQMENELHELGIVWTHLESVYNHLLESGAEIVGEVQFPDGTIQKKFADGLWDKAKGEYCKKHEINLHIDDTLIYNDHFKTPFCRLWSHNNKPKASHKTLKYLP